MRLFEGSPDHPLRRRLWLSASLAGLVVATVVVSQGISRATDPSPLLALGGDFVPAYSAGTLVREGRANDIYNLDPMAGVERAVVAQAKLEPLRLYGTYLNPPWFAAAYAPLSALPYRSAAGVWLGINFLCVTASLLLLRRMLPEGSDWRTWGLIPLIVLISMPFWQAVCHLQNTCMSLLLVCLVVTFWRGTGGKAGKFVAGMCCGLLFYKPQLACVLAAVLCVTLGWRAAVACGLTVAGLVAVTLVTLPGTMEAYLNGLPRAVAVIQDSPIYNWGRQVTPRGFWRLLIQGHWGGADLPIVTGLSWLVMLGAGALLGLAVLRWVRGERDEVSTDRLIAATIAAMPLVMPYYMDYDLMLLAVPATLIAAESGRARLLPSRVFRKSFGSAEASPSRILERQGVGIDRRSVWAWGVMFVALYINPGLSGATRVDLAAALVAIVGTATMIRCWRTGRPAETVGTPAQSPVAKAA